MPTNLKITGDLKVTIATIIDVFQYELRTSAQSWPIPTFLKLISKPNAI